MKKGIEHRLLMKKILLFSLVLFLHFFLISCDVLDNYCSVGILDPNNGAIFEKGDSINFEAYIENIGIQVPRISMVKWTSDKDGDLMIQAYDPPEREVSHSFNSSSLSVNVHEIKCTTFYKLGDSYHFQCSDSILINISENTTTTTMIDLSLFKHAKITLGTVKELIKSDEDPIEDRITDVLSDFGDEGSFSGYDYYAEWFIPADRVTNVETTGSISISLSSTENAVTSAEYHWKQEDLDEDNVFKHTRDFEAAGKSGIPMTNSSSTSLTFKVNGFEVCDYVAFYETIKVMNESVTITRTHSYCEDNSVLEIYLSQ